MGDELNFILDTAQNYINNHEQFRHILVVLCNETCDLDSAVSSLVYSLLLNHLKKPGSIVIPVLNIPRGQLSVKTEVNYFLKKCGINLDNVICRDEIDLSRLQAEGSLLLTLVDHHVLQESDNQLITSVVEVIDHRPHDSTYPWTHATLTLQPVGSCCTLVAQKLLTQVPQLVTPCITLLLLGTILLDTACLSPAVGKATPLDHQIVNELEACCSQPIDREELFMELQTAKSDISSLTADQLLIKDFKVAAGIPIVGLPVKVRSFLEMSDASIAVQEFCKKYKVEMCVLYGGAMDQGTLTKDIAVFSLKHKEEASQIINALTSSKEPDLELQPQLCSLEGFVLFNQLNIKASRKQVLPIIRQVGERLRRR